MKYIILSVPDEVDTSAAAIGAAASVVVGDKTIGDATVQVTGHGPNPAPAASDEGVPAHTHEVAVSAATLATGPAIEAS